MSHEAVVIQEEQDAIYGYTVSYHNINEPLRGLTYYGSQTSAQLGLQRIPLIEGIINKSSYNFDMWLQREDKLVALKKFGLANFSTATDTEIKALIGEQVQKVHLSNSKLLDQRVKCYYNEGQRSRLQRLKNQMERGILI